MIVKDIFKLFIKLVALYYTFMGFISLLGIIVSFNNDLMSPSSLWIIISSIAYMLLFYFLFKKTDYIISFLGLENNFIKQQINFGTLKSSEIIKIALLVVGFLLFIENIPEFISHCFYSFKYSTQSKLYVDNSYSKTDYIQWTTVGIKIIIGYLIIFNSKKLSGWIDKKQE